MLRQPCSWRGIPSPSQISNQNSQRNWRRTKFTESPTTLQLQCHWAQWEGNIQKNLTWKTYLVMPPNLLSFCLGATYNVLPSPKNLKRWHLASESRCFLCHKDVCTIPHILGACKISLQQGRFTFRHDSVLQHLVLVLKSFLKNLPINTTKKCNTIKFVKSGTKCSKTKSSSKGILHLASDWILLADVKGDYLFPFQLALTELCPDILLFSKSSKRAVLVELTCPCEENIENWHSQKLNKYTPLAKVIEKNGWLLICLLLKLALEDTLPSRYQFALKD